MCSTSTLVAVKVDVGIRELEITLRRVGQEFLREWWRDDDGGGATERGMEKGRGEEGRREIEDVK